MYLLFNKKSNAIGLVCFITLFSITQPLEAQEKITGPWLWMIAPTEWDRGGAASIDIDSLDVASQGTVTETDVARNGANPGDIVGNRTWTLSEISPTGSNNINEVVNQFGWNDQIIWSGESNVYQYTSYALITLESDIAQTGVTMRVGSDDAIKVWLNGEVVHTNAIDRGSYGYQDEFPVDLRAGENLLMIKVSQGWSDWSMFVGINADFRAGSKEFSLEPEQRMVQLIYLRPSDRPQLQDIDTKLDTMMKETQLFYAEQMESYGFGKKTFQLQTDNNGKVVVHHINGKFTDTYYQEQSFSRAWEEIEDQFSSANIYILFLDVSVDTFCGAASYGTISGRILIPASGFCLNVRTITHELGHTFGLYHDFRDDAYRMSYGSDSYKLAPCSAEYLNVHPYFNNKPLAQNTPATIEMSPVILSRSDGLRLRFNVADPDGLHQAQLLTPEKPGDPTGHQQLIACRKLEGNSQTIEFITAPLKVKPNVAVTLRVTDVMGNATLQEFPDYLGTALSVNKITGPWLWMIAPTESGRGGADSIDIDSLAVASQGAITETDVAMNGANPGDIIGDHAWTSGEISPTDTNNVNEVINRIGLSSDPDIDDHSSYALITLESDSDQHAVAMVVGSDDAIKVWLNDEVVHTNAINRDASGFQDVFVVDLKKGDNLLFVKVSEGILDWSMFVGVDAEFMPSDIEIPDSKSVAISLSVTDTNLLAGDTFTLNLNAENVTDLAGWQTDIAFDPNVLEVVEVNEGNFLRADGEDTFFQGGAIDNASGKITVMFSVRLSESGVSGTGALLSLTFKAKLSGETQVTMKNFEFSSISGEIIPAVTPNITINVGSPWDVNQDGRASIIDLVFVAKDLGSDAPANSRTDVNRDGVINIQDLILVAQHIGETTDSAAPSILPRDFRELTPAIVQTWIKQAQIKDDESLVFRQGIENLQKLLVSLIPEKTTLLPNYPNPFNAETWIPYLLAKPADVSISIYAVNGTLVRTLTLGHQATGMYQSRSRAAYWDGKNEFGESVASGVYFYTLTAGDFTAKRKMLIRK